MTESNLETNRSISHTLPITVHYPRLSGRKSRKAGTRRQELMQRLWSRAAPLMACLACLHVASRASSPEMSSPKIGQAFPHPSLIKNVYYRAGYRPKLWRDCVIWDSLFPNICRLCQVDINWWEQKGMGLTIFLSCILRHILPIYVYFWIYIFLSFVFFWKFRLQG